MVDRDFGAVTATNRTDAVGRADDNAQVAILNISPKEKGRFTGWRLLPL